MANRSLDYLQIPQDGEIAAKMRFLNNTLNWILRGQTARPVFLLGIAIAVSGLISPHFLTLNNMEAVLVGAAPIMLLCVGEALVVLTGMIDLSPESVLASSGVIMASLDIIIGLATPISITITLLYGAAIGLVTGLLVVRARIPSFVVTLGMYWGLRGLAMVISGGFPVSPNSVSPPRDFTFSGIGGDIYGFPIMVLIALVIGIGFQTYLSNFKMGSDIYAVGGNETAARNCGVNVDYVKVFVFIISGLLGALAGIIMTAWLNQAYAWTAQGFSLQTIAAVVLGGIPFIGGYGSILGVLAGAFMIGMISDIIVLLGISPMYNYIAVAIVLIGAGLQVRGVGLVK